MEGQDAHFRHILLYYFRKGKNASQAHRKLCAVYGNEALKERQCQNWFAKFRSGDFSLRNAHRSGRPVEVDETCVKTIIDSDRRSTTREIAEKLNVSHTCIQNKLKQLGYVKELDLWAPPKGKKIHLTQRNGIGDWRSKRNETDLEDGESERRKGKGAKRKREKRKGKPSTKAARESRERSKNSYS